MRNLICIDLQIFNFQFFYRRRQLIIFEIFNKATFAVLATTTFKIKVKLIKN
jgi:hypothetical protein